MSSSSSTARSIADLFDRGRRGRPAARNRSTSEALISLAIPPGASSHQQRVQPRHHPGPLIADVACCAWRNSRNTSACPTAGTRRSVPGAQRGHRHRQRRRWGRSCSIVPVPNSRVRAANVGGTSTTISPVGDELLSEQEPESRPRPRSPTSASRTAPPRPTTARPGSGSLGPSSIASSSSRSLDRDRGVRRLVGVDPDDHMHGLLRALVGWGTAVGTPACEPGAVPLSSHTAAKPRPSRSSFESQTPQHEPAGPSGATPTETSRRYETAATPARSLKQAHRYHPSRGRARARDAHRAVG